MEQKKNNEAQKEEIKKEIVAKKEIDPQLKSKLLTLAKDLKELSKQDKLGFFIIFGGIVGLLAIILISLAVNPNYDDNYITIVFGVAAAICFPVIAFGAIKETNRGKLRRKIQEVVDTFTIDINKAIGLEDFYHMGSNGMKESIIKIEKYISTGGTDSTKKKIQPGKTINTAPKEVFVKIKKYAIQLAIAWVAIFLFGIPGLVLNLIGNTELGILKNAFVVLTFIGFAFIVMIIFKILELTKKFPDKRIADGFANYCYRVMPLPVLGSWLIIKRSAEVEDNKTDVFAKTKYKNVEHKSNHKDI